MTLGQVQAFVAGVFIFIASASCLMMGISLLLPAYSARAEQALTGSAKACFARGLGVLVFFIVSALLLKIPSPPIRLIGLIGMLGVGAMLVIGAGTNAQLMGSRIAVMSGTRTSFGAVVQGSVIFTLAVLFPLIGWWVFAPLSGIVCMGAGASAVFGRQWAPSRAVEGQGTA